jgi:hypothetical protein
MPGPRHPQGEVEQPPTAQRSRRARPARDAVETARYVPVRVREDVVHGVEVGAQRSEVPCLVGGGHHRLRQVVVDVRVDAEEQVLRDEQALVAADVPARPPAPRRVPRGPLPRSGRGRRSVRVKAAVLIGSSKSPETTRCCMAAVTWAYMAGKWPDASEASLAGGEGARRSPSDRSPGGEPTWDASPPTAMMRQGGLVRVQDPTAGGHAASTAGAAPDPASHPGVAWTSQGSRRARSVLAAACR